MIFTEISRLNRINLRPLYKKSKPKNIEELLASKKTASKKQKEALAQRDKVENIFQFCYVLKKKKTEYKGE
jgi:hypothetical protein